MNDTEVRELLGRAVGTVTVPAGRGGGSVFARAEALRRRRRAVVTGGAAALAVGALFWSGVVPDGTGTRSVAAAPTAGKVDGFEDLLPVGVGTVREVSLGQLIKGTKKPLGGKKVGPFDGEYAVSRDGGVGYVTVHVTRHAKNVEPDPCDIGNVTPPVLKCANEKVSGGGLLSIWLTPATKSVQPSYSGTQLEARLLLKGGTVVSIRDWTGFWGDGSQGPVLKTFPLTREQLRELALRAELLP